MKTKKLILLLLSVYIFQSSFAQNQGDTCIEIWYFGFADKETWKEDSSGDGKAVRDVILTPLNKIQVMFGINKGGEPASIQFIDNYRLIMNNLIEDWRNYLLQNYSSEYSAAGQVLYNHELNTSYDEFLAYYQDVTIDKKILGNSAALDRNNLIIERKFNTNRFDKYKCSKSISTTQNNNSIKSSSGALESNGQQVLELVNEGGNYLKKATEINVDNDLRIKYLNIALEKYSLARKSSPVNMHGTLDEAIAYTKSFIDYYTPSGNATSKSSEIIKSSKNDNVGIENKTNSDRPTKKEIFDFIIMVMEKSNNQIKIKNFSYSNWSIELNTHKQFNHSFSMNDFIETRLKGKTVFLYFKDNHVNFQLDMSNVEPIKRNFVDLEFDNEEDANQLIKALEHWNKL